MPWAAWTAWFALERICCGPCWCAIKVRYSRDRPTNSRDVTNVFTRLHKSYKGKANSWAKKEMHNLDRLHKAGIPCPALIKLKKHPAHILIQNWLMLLPLSLLKRSTLSTTRLSNRRCTNFSANASWSLATCMVEFNILSLKDKCWTNDVSPGCRALPS